MYITLSLLIEPHLPLVLALFIQHGEIFLELFTISFVFFLTILNHLVSFSNLATLLLSPTFRSFMNKLNSNASNIQILGITYFLNGL